MAKKVGIIYDKIIAKPPPRETMGPIRWMKENLFSSRMGVFLTIVSVFMIVSVLVPFVNWAFLDATWMGDKQTDCDRNGACWIFIREKFYQFIYGFYPRKVVWRVNLVFILFPLLCIPFLFKRFRSPWRSYYGFALLFIYPIIGFLTIQGDPDSVCIRNMEEGFCYVPTNKWGGLMVTLILTYLGIILSFPIGVVAGLGRASKLKIIRYFSIGYIEFWRGVPLISILFMTSVVFPLFFPSGMEFDKMLRATLGIVLFQSAYVAEVLRGGLQAIPRGQYEAADALGLSYVKKMYYIVLPQTFKIVLPSLVGISISLMQDTTLILILGLFDILGMVTATTSDVNWLGFEAEGYVFVAIILWTIGYFMSRYGFYLERKNKNS